MTLVFERTQTIEELLETREPFRAEEIDCITAVMLKILDGKCKMAIYEKRIMEELYLLMHGKVGLYTGQSHHELIEKARTERDQNGDLGECLREQVYEQRLYVETMISRPIMKSFKAMLRDFTILPPKI